jgi:hypothetical protein
VPGAPLVAQVNLLPPEIRASRSLAKVKRLLALILVAVLGFGVLGYFWATIQVADANEELDSATAETTRLLNAQMEYSEVPQVLGDLDAATQARLLGMSTEVLWAPYLTQLMTTRPPNVVFESIVLTGATPMVAAAPPINPLEGTSVATLTFTGRSSVVPDTAAWIESLETIPNFSDAYVMSLEITEKEVGGTLTSYYEVIGSVQVTEDAYALRFVEDDTAEDDTAEDESADAEEEQG